MPNLYNREGTIRSRPDGGCTLSGGWADSSKLVSVAQAMYELLGSLELDSKNSDLKSMAAIPKARFHPSASKYGSFQAAVSQVGNGETRNWVWR